MKKVPIVIGILLVISLSMALVIGGMLNGKTVVEAEGNRPNHCINNVCVDEVIFSKLPSYPENFKEVVIGFYNDVYSTASDFSSKHPDENYWKQPEFYGEDDFVKQGLKYYTTTKIKWSGGSGPYKGSFIISNISVNDTFPVYTYWHSGYAIWKYQLLKLVPSFPENATIRLGTYTIIQNPEEAAKCIDVNIIPEHLILEPTWPVFGYNWTQKVIAEITPKCVGKWVVDISPDKPDADVRSKYIYELGLFNISDVSLGGVWQIFIEVQ